MKIAHIAGGSVSVDGVNIQRCACCGKLLRRIAYSPDRDPGDFSINYMRGTVVVIDDKEEDVLKRIETYAMSTSFETSGDINTPEYPPIKGARYCWENEVT